MKDMLLRSKIVFAPPNDMTGIPSFGDGTGTGTGSQLPGSEGFDDGSGGNQGPLYGQEEEVDTDLEDVLKAFGTGTDEDLDDTNIDSGDVLSSVPAEAAQAMQAEVHRLIGNMRFDATKLPENFDPSDPAQLAQAFDAVTQQAVAQSLNVVFKPVQLAMNHMVEQLGQSMDRKLKAAQTREGAVDIISQKVPEINNPKYQKMVKDFDRIFQSQGKKPAERAALLRKTLNSMGINDSTSQEPNARRASAGSSQPNASYRTGKSALDNFFPTSRAPK